MVKNYNTKTIFQIKKIVFVQLVLGTFMASATYAENSNGDSFSETHAPVTLNSTSFTNSKTTTEEFKTETQNRFAIETITGKVVDEQGNTLPGVNVMKKGSKTGVSTDFEGNFTIDANKGEILVFSYIGFNNQEIQIRDNKNLKIVMKSEAQQMSEVVIVGYGSQKKTNLTGSVTQIDAKVLKDRPITRLSQGLQGAVGGRRPAGRFEQLSRL